MITFPQVESCANELDLSCGIDSGCGHSFEIDRGNLLVEENVLVGHAHRKRDSEVRVNDSEVPRGRGDSGLTTGVDVVQARELRGGSYSDAEVDAPDLANRSEELPIPRLLGVMDRRRAQKFVAGAIPARAAVVHGGYHFSSPMNRMRSTFSVVSASRKKMGFLSFVPRSRSHSARRWSVSLSWTMVVSMKGLDPLRKSCPPLFGAVMALTAHIFATFSTTSVNISCWSICNTSRPHPS